MFLLELPLALTPGLHLFLLREAQGMVSHEARVSTFYSVTVLTLFGHFPGAVIAGLLMRGRGAGVEVSVTCAAMIWLVCAITSIGLLLLHVTLSLPFFFHALVVLALVLGTILRLLGVIFLPLSYYHQGDALHVLVWWWLLMGLDWPAYATQWGVFLELSAVLAAAQMVQPADGGVPEAPQAAVVIAVPIALRLTGLSLFWWMSICIPFLLVYYMVAVIRDGSALSLNRVFDNFVAAAYGFDEEPDLEGGFADALHKPRLVLGKKGE